MGRALPLFPLGTVLFPGLVLPLHVFEERYRALVRHVTALPEGRPREFGVVAIQRGWEVEQVAGATRRTPDADAPSPPGELEMRASLTLHEVGCTAEVRQVTEHPDGRFDLVTVGRRRFRIARVDPGSAPYLLADVEYLSELLGPPEVADRLAPRVLAAFRRYLALVRPNQEEIAEQLPEEPTVLSHLVAATAVLTIDDRQRLLAEPDTVSRLRAELALLSREEALLRRVRAVPVPLGDLAVPMSPN
ncbi:MAG TPA: LON peptidase substrate-binding domain-containing protein [Micromonosporaceae bacterium]|jgi:hypothetical protein|nr:LON peptidase substrate-binding domain-containing protein [Micromonosporaceae bacterium]